MSEWISVNDRLPEKIPEVKYIHVLAIHKDWDNFCRILLYDADELEFTSGYGDTQKATHWMPLPDPPK
jgi:hypothetical protein